MKVIEQYPNGVSVIEKNGVYMVHDERWPQTYEMLCKSCEEAKHHARLESWRYIAYDYYKQAHRDHTAIMSSVCGTCPFRDTSGCLGTGCPVHHIQDEINGAMKLIEKTNKMMRKKIEWLTANG